MKYKILVSLVIILFLINIIAVANPASNKFKENKTTYMDDPVPTWNEGDSWTYTFSNFTVDYDYYDLKIYMNGRIDNLKWTVVDTSGTDYIVDLTGKITANSYELNVPLSSRIIYISGSIKPLLTRLSGTIVFTKSDLEIKDISAELKGITAAKIGSFFLPLPIPFKITLDGDLSTLLPLFDFPLSDNKYWSLPAITIKSNVKIGGLFGIIKFPFTISTSYSWIPFAFHCKPKVSVTVEAGIYSAYEIESTFFGIFEYYYAPVVGNIVKIDATMPNGAVHGELKSTTYT